MATHSPKKKDPPTLSIDGIPVTDNAVIAEALNAYFGSVFVIDDGRAPEFSKFDHTEPMDNVSISEERILALLLKLDDKKSPGIDGIPNAFLKRYAEWCLKYVFFLLKCQINEGVVVIVTW